MKYIYKSLDFSQRNLGLLGIFILINIFPAPLSLLYNNGEESNISNMFLIILIIVSLLLFILNIFLISGTYSLIWKKFKDKHISYSSLISESKKYFSNNIGIGLAIGFTGFIVALFIIVIVGVFSKDIDNRPDYTDFSIIVPLYFYLLLTIFCYAIPYLYVKEMNYKNAFFNSPKILINHIKQSFPIILLLFINLVISFSTSYDQSYYFSDIIIEIIIYYISFNIFIITCQILDEIDISDFENGSTQNRKII